MDTLRRSILLTGLAVFLICIQPLAANSAPSVRDPSQPQIVAASPIDAVFDFFGTMGKKNPVEQLAEGIAKSTGQDLSWGIDVAKTLGCMIAENQTSPGDIQLALSKAGLIPAPGFEDSVRISGAIAAFAQDHPLIYLLAVSTLKGICSIL